MRRLKTSEEEQRALELKLNDITTERDTYQHERNEVNDLTEKLAQEKRRLEEEIEHLQLTNKHLLQSETIEGRTAELEGQLLDEQDKINDLQDKLKEAKNEDRPLKRKVSQLDKNLEQLTVMYHKLVSQNSGLKVECQVNEEKNQRKEQRIAQLERNLREAKQKYVKLLTQCANLTAAMDAMGRTKATAGLRLGGSEEGEGYAGSSAAGLGFGGPPRKSNIVRPMKGGIAR